MVWYGMVGGDRQASILIVQDKHKNVFGVFSYGGWLISLKHKRGYLDGRCFLFTLVCYLLSYPRLATFPTCLHHVVYDVIETKC
jgi:hypothetical protein